MLDDLEKRWAVLQEEEKDPLRLIDRQNAFLEATANTLPQFVVEKCKDVAERAGMLAYQPGLIYCNGVLGYAYYMLSEYDTALPLLQDTLAALSTEEESPLRYRLTGTIALIHISLGNFQQALQYGFQTRDLLQQIGDRTQEGWTVHGFGMCYQEMGLVDEALKAYTDSLAIFEETDELNGIGRALTGIGSIYQGRGEFEKSMPYHEKSLAFFQKTDNKAGESRALNDLGVIFQHRGDFERAQTFHERSLKIRQQTGNRQAQSTSYMNLGRLARAQGALPKALQLFEQSLALAEEVGAKKRRFELHQLLAQTFEETGNLEEALTHFKAFYELRHEIFNKQISTRINSLQATFDKEKAERETEIARIKNTELREKNEQLRKLLDELRATQNQLLHAEKMASLGQLTAGIAHEIKNPLNFVNNFAALSTDLVEELRDLFETNKEKTVAEILEEVQDLFHDLYFNAKKINEHGQRADRIIQSMLEHARGNKGHKQQIDINQILKEYIKLAYHGMRATNSSFFAKIEERYAAGLPHIEGIPHDLGRVFLNLMSNSFYAMAKKSQQEQSDYQPVLSIETQCDDTHIIIVIRDNGSGIPHTIQQNIFNPFFSTKPSGEGTGLGLSLSYEIINGEHNGELYLDQSSHAGTSFIIKLPYSTTTTNVQKPGVQ